MMPVAASNLDFLRYLITRHEPQDGPQTQVVGFLRNLFADRVLTNTMLKTTAISDAGLTKQTIYEISRQGMTRTTYSRAIEALDAVNREIEQLIPAIVGEGAMKRKDLVNALLRADPAPAPSDTVDPKPARVAAGSVRAMGLELHRLTEQADEAQGTAPADREWLNCGRT